MTYPDSRAASSLESDSPTCAFRAATSSVSKAREWT